MISDGYGDELTDEELVENYWKWAHKIAWDWPDQVDDVAQEGLIHVWRTAVAHPGKPAAYLAKAGRYRMQDVATGKAQTFGNDPTPGPRYRPDERSVDWDAVAIDDEGSPDWMFKGLLQAADVLGAVDWAYHHGEISEVLSSLLPEDRDYVVLRFWHGYTDTEIAAMRGVRKQVPSNNWTRRIKPVLAEALAHLAEA